MKQILLIFVIFLYSIPAYSAVSWNGFEPTINGNGVSHKQYYGERLIEPYRWGNYEEKPIKQWYSDTMKVQRKRIKADYKTYYNWNDLNNHSFWK